MNTYGGEFYKNKGSATGIGYGKRSDFTRCLTVSPSSSKYHLKTFWEQNADKNKGAVMGLSRNVDFILFREFLSTVIYQNSSVRFPLQVNTSMKNLEEQTHLNIHCALEQQ